MVRDDVQRGATHMSNEAEKRVKELYKPPSEFQMRFCPSCGRDDLSLPLKSNHYASGQKCGGTPTTVAYTRKD